MGKESTLNDREKETVQHMYQCIASIEAAFEVGDGCQSERKWLDHYRKGAREEFGETRAKELYAMAVRREREDRRSL